MNSLERLAHEAWEAWGTEYVFYGRCAKCGRVRDDDDRPLLVRGPRRKSVRCLDCHDRGK